jgi:purine-binding chemotaxis protein CheW
MQREMRAVVATTSDNRSCQEDQQRSEKYLTFRLGSDIYAVPCNRVQEIMGVQEIKVVSSVPVFVKGVINVRGKIIPVIDLRLKFGFSERAYKRRTCMIVTQIENSTAGKLTMGIVVDSVAHVLTLKAGDFQNGSAKVDGKVNILLDLDILLSSDEIDRLIGVCY